MQLRFERTEERLTRRSGLVLMDRFGKQLDVGKRIDELFPKPGSNRGFAPSMFVSTLMEMFIDGATCLEDVRAFEADEAYKRLTGRLHYPTSDALGDWLRRHGRSGGEGHIGRLTNELVRQMSHERELTLDIDTSFILSDKGDAERNYEGDRSYNPVLGLLPELGLLLAPRFQQGSITPQTGLDTYLGACLEALPERIGTVRLDSAGYNFMVLDLCFRAGLSFSITADHDEAVMAAVHEIPENAWKQGRSGDGGPTDYEYAEAVPVHTLARSHQGAFRLVAKRVERTRQLDLFEKYFYWVIATNTPREERSAQAVIHFHEDRGEFERVLGELKSQLHLNHLPCGQITANGLFFSIGVLTYDLLQLLKREHFGTGWKKKTVASLRYLWFHAPARLVTHARSMTLRVAMAPEYFVAFLRAWCHMLYAPAPG